MLMSELEGLLYLMALLGSQVRPLLQVRDAAHSQVVVLVHDLGQLLKAEIVHRTILWLTQVLQDHALEHFRSLEDALLDLLLTKDGCLVSLLRVFFLHILRPMSTKPTIALRAILALWCEHGRASA